jgi:adenine-specific DNA-methyltransferase
MATSRTLDPASLRPDDHYVGAAGDEHVWMLYRPDLD